MVLLAVCNACSKEQMDICLVVFSSEKAFPGLISGYCKSVPLSLYSRTRVRVSWEEQQTFQTRNEQVCNTHADNSCAIFFRCSKEIHSCMDGPKLKMTFDDSKQCAHVTEETNKKKNRMFGAEFKLHFGAHYSWAKTLPQETRHESPKILLVWWREFIGALAVSFRLKTKTQNSLLYITSASLSASKFAKWRNVQWEIFWFMCDYSSLWPTFGFPWQIFRKRLTVASSSSLPQKQEQRAHTEASVKALDVLTFQHTCKTNKSWVSCI